jgi:hypothetical protein
MKHIIKFPSFRSPLASLFAHFLLGLVLGVFFHYLLYRIFLPAEPFIYAAF